MRFNKVGLGNEKEIYIMKRPIFRISSLLLCLYVMGIPLSSSAKSGEEYQQEIRMLRKRNTQLENQLEQVTTTLSMAQAELEKQKKQFKANLVLLHEREQELQETNMKVRRMNTIDPQANERVAELKTTLENVNGQLVKLSEENIRLETQVMAFQRKLQTVEHERDELLITVKEYPLLQQEIESLRGQIADFSQEQSQNELTQGELQQFQAVSERARKEAESLVIQNLELKAKLQSKEEAYQSQEQQFRKISARNRELEQRDREDRGKLELKEKILQQTLLEKMILEKRLDELTGKMHQVEAQSTFLQKQFPGLEASQAPISQMMVPDNSAELSPPLAVLQQKLLREETLRQQREAELETIRSQVQTFQEQIMALNTQLAKQSQVAVSMSSPPPLFGNSIRAIFPPEIVSSGIVTVLNWSSDRSKMAYLETNDRKERLWIFNSQTRQPVKITEWQRSSGATNSSVQFAWAYDNHHFLFATGFPGQYVLYLGNSNRLLGQPIQLHEQYIHFAWSPKQLQFAYFSGTKLIIQNLQGQVLPVQIGHQPGLAGTSLAWDPDGTRIALCAKRGTNFDIYLLLFSTTPPLLQPLVISPSDDLQPSWSPDGQRLAFYVHIDQYDTKIAVTPVNQNRSPYVIGHNVSFFPEGGPRWLTNTELVYMGEEQLSASHNSVYRVDLETGQRSSAPLSMLFSP